MFSSVDAVQTIPNSNRRQGCKIVHDRIIPCLPLKNNDEVGTTIQCLVSRRRLGFIYDRSVHVQVSSRDEC